MFREMRRKEKQLSTAEANSVLHGARYGVLAVNGDNGYPYAIPVNYFYNEQDKIIYFHGAGSGHKAEAIKNCGKVCFTVCGKECIKNEPWAPYVKSVVVFGKCTPVKDTSTALELVKIFAEKYYPDTASAEQEVADSGSAVTMYQIKIEHLTAKEIQEK